MTRYVAAFCAMALAIAFAGRRAYVGERQEVHGEIRAQLEQIASVKAAQVSSWRFERIGDAFAAEAGALLMPAVQDVARGLGDRVARARVLTWLDTVRANYQYASVSLVDAFEAPRRHLRGFDARDLIELCADLGADFLPLGDVRAAAGEPDRQRDGAECGNVPRHRGPTL